MPRFLLLASAMLAGLLILTGVVLGQGPAFTGRVTSPDGPVAGALVGLIGSGGTARTDAQGRYSLSPKEGTPWQSGLAAGKEGYFNNAVSAVRGLPGGEIRLNPVFLDDDPSYRFQSPGLCVRCHTKLTYYWDQSKMSKTTSNPRLLDLYYGTDADQRPGVGPGYKLDNPDKAGDCAVCHAPSATAAGVGGGDLRTILTDVRTEWNGVSCDYCHKIRKVTEDPAQPSHYAAVLERQTPVRGRSILVFGPYPDVVVPPMAASYNPVFDQGLFCATCHSHFQDLDQGRSWDYSKVYTQEEWAAFGLKDGSKLPLQTTFAEWKQWQEGLAADDPNRGKRCQSCHMSWQKRMLPYDNYLVDGMARSMWGSRRSAEIIHPHVYEGGTSTQLPTAVSLEVAGEIKGDRLHLKVAITNTNGGHWVPTGEPMRSVILLVQAADSQGRPLELVQGGRVPDWVGPGRPSGQEYAGRPGALFARILGDEAGNLNVPSWKATRIVSDTRIRPKTTTIQEYVFSLTDPEDEPQAEARLVYRAAPASLVQAKKWVVHDLDITSRAW